MSIRLILLLLGLAASASACALVSPEAGGSPPQAVVRADELRATGAPDLLSAVARARPGWMLMAGDTALAADRERVLVYVDRRYAGTLERLRTIPVEAVASVRLRDEQYVRATDRRHPRTAFVAALYVARAEDARDVPHRRWSVSAGASRELMEASRLLRAGLVDEGFGDPRPQGGNWFVVDEPERTFLGGAAVNYTTPGGWGVELAALRSLAPTWTYGFRMQETGAVSAYLEGVEVSLMPTYTMSPLRVGIGPVYRALQADWRRGFCVCHDEQRVNTSALGVAAAGVLEAPAYGSYFVEVNARLRYYPSHNMPYEGQFESAEAGGVLFSGGLGLGFRF